MDLTLIERGNLRKSVEMSIYLWRESHNEFDAKLQ